jgi:hypothetical protein
MSGITVDQVFLVGKWDDYAGNANKSAKDWLQALDNDDKMVFLDENGPYHDQDAPNPELDCGSAKIWVAAAGVGSGKNDKSVVLVITHGDVDFLLTGDATFETEEQVVDWHGDWLQSEILKVGHHGSKWTSTSQAWVDIVQPEVAVFSATSGVKHGHPNIDVVERLAKSTEPGTERQFLAWENKNTPVWVTLEEQIYSTAIDQNVLIVSDGEYYVVNP